MLFLCGMLGVAIHSLIKINSLKKSGKPFSLASYINAEWAAIAVSVVVVITAIIVKTEITQLAKVEKYLSICFVSFGYMGQSIVVAVMGKAEKQISTILGQEIKEEEK
jgi:hypothetical protein